MIIDLLKDITINCRTYKWNAGWEISTDIPDELIGQLMTVKLEGYCYTDFGGHNDFVHTFNVTAEFFLDEIIAAIVSEVRKLMGTDARGDYFIDHCYLEGLELDTDTMTVKTTFGS